MQDHIAFRLEARLRNEDFNEVLAHAEGRAFDDSTTLARLISQFDSNTEHFPFAVNNDGSLIEPGDFELNNPLNVFFSRMQSIEEPAEFAQALLPRLQLDEGQIAPFMLTQRSEDLFPGSDNYMRSTLYIAKCEDGELGFLAWPVRLDIAREGFNAESVQETMRKLALDNPHLTAKHFDSPLAA